MLQRRLEGLEIVSNENTGHGGREVVKNTEERAKKRKIETEGCQRLLKRTALHVYKGLVFFSRLIFVDNMLHSTQTHTMATLCYQSPLCQLRLDVNGLKLSQAEMLRGNMRRLFSCTVASVLAVSFLMLVNEWWSILMVPSVRAGCLEI